jgi:uncharacterized integral membrane protein
MTITQSKPATSETTMRTPPAKATARTRISGAWVAVITATAVLVLLLVFILQNTRSVRISYFTANGSMPLGVALLLGVIGGVLLAGVFSALRIVQLRHRLSGRRGLDRQVTGLQLSDEPAPEGNV